MARPRKEVNGLRRCSRCGKNYPPTLEYFYQQSYRVALQPACKGCQITAAVLARRKRGGY